MGFAGCCNGCKNRCCCTGECPREWQVTIGTAYPNTSDYCLDDPDLTFCESLEGLLFVFELGDTGCGDMLQELAVPDPVISDGTLCGAIMTSPVPTEFGICGAYEARLSMFLDGDGYCQPVFTILGGNGFTYRFAADNAAETYECCPSPPATDTWLVTDSPNECAIDEVLVDTICESTGTPSGNCESCINFGGETSIAIDFDTLALSDGATNYYQCDCSLISGVFAGLIGANPMFGGGGECVTHFGTEGYCLTQSQAGITNGYSIEAWVESDGTNCNWVVQLIVLGNDAGSGQGGMLKYIWKSAQQATATFIADTSWSLSLTTQTGCIEPLFSQASNSNCGCTEDTIPGTIYLDIS